MVVVHANMLKMGYVYQEWTSSRVAMSHVDLFKHIFFTPCAYSCVAVFMLSTATW